MFHVSHHLFHPFPALNVDGLFGMLSNKSIMFLVFHYYILYILILDYQ